MHKGTDRHTSRAPQRRAERNRRRRLLARSCAHWFAMTRSFDGKYNFVSYIIYYFFQKEKRVTKNLHLGLLFGNFYDII